MTEKQKLKDIAFILKDLLKVIKVVSIYPENNPLPASLRRSFSEKLESVVDEYGELIFNVENDHLTYDEEIVYESKSKEENLAAIFYEAGITEISFIPGLDVLEIYSFLDAVKLYINSNDKSLDLVAILWEATVVHIRFKTLQDIALSEYDEDFNLNEFISVDDVTKHHQQALFGVDDEGSELYQQIFTNSESIIEHVTFEETDIPPSNSSPVPRVQGRQQGNRTAVSSSVLIDNNEDAVTFKASEAASAMGFSDIAPAEQIVPDTTLILNQEFEFSQMDEEKVRAILEEDAYFDPYRSTVELLKEMLHQESEMNSFYETVTICEKIMSEFIAQSRIAEAGQILKYLKALDEKIRSKKPLWAERLKEACISAGSKERLKNLGKALNDNADISTAELKSYLSHFTWESLLNITDLIGVAEHQTHKDCLVEYLSQNGKNYVDVVGKGIFEKRPDVVCNAISILARIGDEKAIHYLSKVVDHKEDVVRLRLVTSLKDSPDDAVLSILKRAVFDKHSQVRREAVNSIVWRKGKAAFEIITDIINEDDFTVQDDQDQAALLLAYSKLGGEHAVEYLIRIVKANNLFRDAKLSFLRKAAFEALQINKSEKCERELLKLTRSLRPDIKHQAHDTLRQRRDYIYGELD